MSDQIPANRFITTAPFVIKWFYTYASIFCHLLYETYLSASYKRDHSTSP